MIKIINVTREDIKTSIMADIYSCAINKALVREGYTNVKVTWDNITFTDQNDKKFIVPEWLEAWQKNAYTLEHYYPSKNSTWRETYPLISFSLDFENGVIP